MPVPAYGNGRARAERPRARRSLLEGGAEVALEVAIRSPEIQDAEPIHSAPMTEAAASSHGGIELLADDLVEPATVAKHLEAIRQAEQRMMVSSRSF
jgi:hypothetical protein